MLLIESYDLGELFKKLFYESIFFSFSESESLNSSKEIGRFELH